MSDLETGDAPPKLAGGSTSTELSATNTRLALERTRMSTDNTLMAMLRTSLSLIGFGFTIYKVFSAAASEKALIHGDVTARRLGLSLLALGILLLAMGIVGHIRYSRELSRRHDRLFRLGLLHERSEYRSPPPLIVAMLLLLIGVLAFASTFIRLNFL
jgi:putative membrane protein